MAQGSEVAPADDEPPDRALELGCAEADEDGGAADVAPASGGAAEEAGPELATGPLEGSDDGPSALDEDDGADAELGASDVDDERLVGQAASHGVEEESSAEEPEEDEEDGPLVAVAEVRSDDVDGADEEDHDDEDRGWLDPLSDRGALEGGALVDAGEEELDGDGPVSRAPATHTPSWHRSVLRHSPSRLHAWRQSLPRRMVPSGQTTHPAVTATASTTQGRTRCDDIPTPA